MSVTDVTRPGQTDTLEFDLRLDHPPAKVWRALTDPALLTQWLLPIVDVQWQLGSAFTFQAPPQPGWDGVVHCRLLEMEAPRTLRYAWVVGDLDTVVTFTLSAAGTGSVLSIRQSGFKEDQKRNFGGARYGWKMMSGRLIELLENDA